MKYLYLIFWFLLGLVVFVFHSSYSDNTLRTTYIEIHWSSMYPTLENGKLYPAKKIDNISSLQRGDIVVFSIPWAANSYVKRLQILPEDRFQFSYEDDGNILVLSIKWWSVMKFKKYKHTKFYKTLLLWSENTTHWWVKAPQCGLFWDNTSNSVDTLEYGFIGCNRISHVIEPSSYE